MSLVPVLVLVWVIGIPLSVGAIATASRAYYRRRTVDCRGTTATGPLTWEPAPVEAEMPITLDPAAARLTRAPVSRG
jgi:hypothetical protein